MTNYGKISAADLEKLEEAYEKLKKNPQNNTIMAKNLTPELFEMLKTRTTPKFGANLLDLIAAGINDPTEITGVLAADADCYEVFEPFLKNVIKDRHLIDRSSDLFQPEMNFGKTWELEKIDPENKYIISTRCRTARSLKSFPFNQKMTKENYIAMEKYMKNIFKQLTGDLKGEYLSLSEMSEEKKNELIDSHFLFEASNKLLVAGNADKYFPTGRGIFMNDSKTFMVWVGEEDHLRLISLEQGSEIKNVVRRLDSAIQQLSTNIDFVRTKELGFISTCPANLGTGVRCSILAKLPKLSADMNKFKELAKKHNLQIRGEYGVNSVSKNPIYDLSNVRKYGITEREIIDIVVKGCKAILEEEKRLESC